MKEGEAHVESNGNDTVKLLTIHKSRTSRFPVVSGAGFLSGIISTVASFHLPQRQSGTVRCNDMNVEKPSRYLELEAEEDRGLAASLKRASRTFVCNMTRARDHLIISSRAENSKSERYCCSDKLARVAGHNFRCGRLGRSYRTAALRRRCPWNNLKT